jgi:hypothetical protein
MLRRCVLLPSSGLSFYSYQKDDWVLPGYLLQDTVSAPRYKAPLAFPKCFVFASTLLLSYLSLSISILLRFQRVNNVYFILNRNQICVHDVVQLYII